MQKLTIIYTQTQKLLSSLFNMTLSIARVSINLEQKRTHALTLLEQNSPKGGKQSQISSEKLF